MSDNAKIHMMNAVIIKYNAGNIRSVDFALKRMGIEAEITDDQEKILHADKVIFPGVGEASSTMQYLKEKSLDKLLRDLKVPVLGICLGQQLMCSRSEEGLADCIGIFDQPVRHFPPGEKIPHMGWNQLFDLSGPLMKGVVPGSYVYFVHSYYVPVCENTAAASEYIIPFSASLWKDNFFATQFHPEKSGDTGFKILQNFMEL